MITVLEVGCYCSITLEIEIRSITYEDVGNNPDCITKLQHENQYNLNGLEFPLAI